MYKSGLVPRRMAWFGMIGGPLLLFGNFGVLFDWWEGTGLIAVLVVPEIIWEAFLGIYCAIWGFRRDSPDRPPQLARRCSRLNLSQLTVAATARSVRRRLRGVVSDRLVRQWWRCARLRRGGSGVDELGG